MKNKKAKIQKLKPVSEIIYKLPIKITS